MIARRIVVRPSIGDPGTIWIEIDPAAGGASLGAHLSPAGARRLVVSLMFALSQIEEEEQSP